MKKILLSLVLLVGLTSAPVFAAPQGLNYLNGDADILLHFDLKRLQASQTFKDVMAMAMSNPKAKKGLDEVKEKLGVDVLKDVHSVTLQVKAPSEKKGRATILGYVKGKFSPPAILAALKAENAKIQESKTPWGVMYTMTPEPAAFAFVKGGMVFGTPNLVQAHKMGAFKGNLAAASQIFKDQAQDLWVVIKMNEAMSKEASAKNPMLAQFTQFVGALDLTSGLHLNVRATSKDASGPKMLAQMGQKQLAQMGQSPQAAMFGGMMKKISINAENNDLVLDIPLNQQDVNQIKMMVGMMLMSFQKKAAAPMMPPKRAPAVPVSPAPK